MELSKILSISGRPGLYKVISQAKNAVIVESLIDQKRFPVFGHEKMSSLEEISIFTNEDDIPLKDVLKAMHENLQEKEVIDPKSDSKLLKEFFLEVVPDYDQERVYVSDIKKVMNWYSLLSKNDLLDFSDEEESKEESTKKSSEEVIEEKEPKEKKEE